MLKVIIFACSRMDTLAHVPRCTMNCSHVALQLSGGAESAAAVLALRGAIGVITRLPAMRRRVAESMQARVSRDLDGVGVHRKILVPMHCCQGLLNCSERIPRLAMLTALQCHSALQCGTAWVTISFEVRMPGPRNKSGSSARSEDGTRMIAIIGVMIPIPSRIHDRVGWCILRRNCVRIVIVIVVMSTDIASCPVSRMRLVAHFHCSGKLIKSKCFVVAAIRLQAKHCGTLLVLISNVTTPERAKSTKGRQLHTKKVVKPE